MKFQWYVIDTVEKTVQGTNDVEQIEKLVSDNRYILLTAQHGKFFNGSNDENDVEEIGAVSDDEDSDDDEDVAWRSLANEGEDGEDRDL